MNTDHGCQSLKPGTRVPTCNSVSAFVLQERFSVMYIHMLLHRSQEIHYPLTFACH